MADRDDGAIVMRVHRVRAEIVVAACDAELLETDLPMGSSGHTVRVSSHFYGDRRVGRDEFLWALGQATTANLLGARALKWAVEAGIVDPARTGALGGVPHAEIFRMPS